MAQSPGTIRAGQGTVEVSGTAEVAEQSFTSPLTEQECVAYRFEKEAKLPSKTRNRDEGEKRRHTWQSIHLEEAGAPFYVADGGERVLVDGSTADLDMDRSFVVETSDFEEGIGDTLLATVTGREAGGSDKAREVADEYVEEVASANNPRRYKEWLIHAGERVTVQGVAVTPEQTPIGSRLDAGAEGPTEPASSGIVGRILGVLGLGDEVPADPRARYKPRAIERLPGEDSDATGGTDTRRAQEIRKTVSTFEGLPQGELSENPDAVEHMMAEARAMTDEERRIADEAMPDAPALEGARVVISWGKDSEFVVSDSM